MYFWTYLLKVELASTNPKHQVKLRLLSVHLVKVLSTCKADREISLLANRTCVLRRNNSAQCSLPRLGNNFVDYEEQISCVKTFGDQNTFC